MVVYRQAKLTNSPGVFTIFVFNSFFILEICGGLQQQAILKQAIPG